MATILMDSAAVLSLGTFVKKRGGRYRDHSQGSSRTVHLGVTPGITSGNGPQFIAKDFKHFIRLCGMLHVRTSPCYPQSNGKIERCHRTIKSDCIRPLSPLCLKDAEHGVEKQVIRVLCGFDMISAFGWGSHAGPRVVHYGLLPSRMVVTQYGNRVNRQPATNPV